MTGGTLNGSPLAFVIPVAATAGSGLLEQIFVTTAAMTGRIAATLHQACAPS
jgi:hypothetical protein